LEDKEHIGLLGLGSFTTQLYLRLLNKFYSEIHGGFSTCPLIMLNANFEHINPHLPNKFDKLIPVTEKYIAELNEQSIRCMVVPNITLHETIDRISLPTGVNLIHPVMETIMMLKKDQVREVILMGTKHTMNSDYIRSHFENQGITVSLPNEDDQSKIDQLRQDIYRGKESKLQQHEFNDLCEQYCLKAPVVLSCTELSIVKLSPRVSIYDMVKIQVKRAIETLD
jgi:aspartate racemase